MSKSSSGASIFGKSSFPRWPPPEARWPGPALTDQGKVRTLGGPALLTPSLSLRG